MLNRRELLSSIAATGIGTGAFHRAIAALASKPDISADMIRNAEWISGIELSESQRSKILQVVRRNVAEVMRLRTVPLAFDDAPATYFQPLQKGGPNRGAIRQPPGRTAAPRVWSKQPLPNSEEGIAFLPVQELAALIRSGRLKSTQLTKLYLARLKKYGPMLRCVVNVTEELALKQAANADREIEAGNYRGPLHGIPWGAKDLLAVPGYPTTWGIPHFKDRELKETATVVERLVQAGAVLVAKLSMGALAMGDRWFGGMTRSPWNAKRGSSGSSSGSAAATAAGLVGFSLGTETLGSIISPSRRCGVTGFRPTFGRVSRAGCMSLSWSMDKVGPICRSVEGAAIVFDAIHGSDGIDPTVGDFDFNWPPRAQTGKLKVGYVRRRGQKIDEREDLGIVQSLGCDLVEVQLPHKIPVRTMTSIINIEGASMFEELLRAGHTEGWNSWERTFQSANFFSAVDYLRMQRARTRLMRLFEEAIEGVDVLINAGDLLHTNLTGHPSVAVPDAFRKGETPTPICSIFTGRLHEDEKMLALAAAYQEKVDAHLKRPPIDKWLKAYEEGTLDGEKKPPQ